MPPQVELAELSPRQTEALLALFACKSIEAAAKKARVSVTQLYEWLKQPAFRRAKREVQRSLFEQGVAQLFPVVKDAVATLKRNLHCGNPPTEVRAAIGVLDKVANVQAVADIQAEVDELRAELERRNAADTRQPEAADRPPEDGLPGGGPEVAVGDQRDAGEAAGGPAAAVPGGGDDA